MFPVILLVLFAKHELGDGSQSLWAWLEHWWLHLCKELLEQVFDFRGMKSSALQSTCCMKQGPHGCLMMSGGNWWKNREKLKHVRVELLFFFLFFSCSMCFASELFQLFTFFHRSSSAVMVFFHLYFSCIFPLVPLFPVAKGKQKVEKSYKVQPFQYNWKD